MHSYLECSTTIKTLQKESPEHCFLFRHHPTTKQGYYLHKCRPYLFSAHSLKNNFWHIFIKNVRIHNIIPTTNPFPFRGLRCVSFVSFSSFEKFYFTLHLLSYCYPARLKICFGTKEMTLLVCGFTVAVKENQVKSSLGHPIQ